MVNVVVAPNGMINFVLSDAELIAKLPTLPYYTTVVPGSKYKR